MIVLTITIIAIMMVLIALDLVHLPFPVVVSSSAVQIL